MELDRRHYEQSLGIYLIAGMRGRLQIRRFINAVLYWRILRQAIRFIRKSLDYRKPITIVGDNHILLTGIRDIRRVRAVQGKTQNTYARWACTCFKWEIDSFYQEHDYLLFTDADTLLLSDQFLKKYFIEGNDIALIRSPIISPYSHALLSPKFHDQYRFDSCVILGRSTLLQELFKCCHDLLSKYQDVYEKYGEMPFMNRALVDLGISDDKISAIDGVSFAQHSNDYSYSVFHFNSGNLLTKMWHMHQFKKRYRAFNRDQAL